MTSSGGSGESAVGGCSVCRQLRLDGPDGQTYVVVPARGGGWPAWSGALLRFVERIGAQPTQIVIIEQPVLTNRYVQVFIGHGSAYAEASSNVYLSGHSSLTADHEDLLAMLGWLAPEADSDNEDEPSQNWHLPLIHGGWLHLVETLVATVVGVFGFDEHVPVSVRSFGASSPCRACSWPDDKVARAT